MNLLYMRVQYFFLLLRFIYYRNQAMVFAGYVESNEVDFHFLVGPCQEVDPTNLLVVGLRGVYKRSWL